MTTFTNKHGVTFEVAEIPEQVNARFVAIHHWNPGKVMSITYAGPTLENVRARAEDCRPIT